MKKQLVNVALKTASFFKAGVNYNNKFKNEKQKIINLGCGLHCLSNWVNVDGSLTALLGTKYTAINKFLYKIAGSSQYYAFDEFNDVIKNKKLYWYDLAYGVPFKSNSVDVVFTSHFLEHLDKEKGINFLEEIFRVLKDGGLLRIIVPDLDTAFRMYNEGNVDKMQDLFFYTSKDCDFSAHKYNYNFNTLKEKLSKIGFKNITKEGYLIGNCPDIKYLDVYPEHSLYVEAYK